MIKNVKALIAGTALLSGMVLTVHTASSVTPDRGIETPSIGESTGSPGSLYAAHCASCHGRDGRAATAKGRRLDATDFTGDWNKDEARAVRIITNGKGDMPGFKRKLTPEQVRSVFEYTRRFGG